VEKLPEVMLEKPSHLCRSVVRIQSGRSRGTGFWVKGLDGQRYILTCAHVLEDEKDIEICLFNGKDAYEKAVSATLVLPLIPVEEGDIALLQVAQGDIPGNVLALHLLDIDFQQPPPFEAWGFPDAFSSHGRAASGIVVSDTTSNEGASLLQLQTAMDIRQGFSGGPIVHRGLGFVLGMISDGEPPTVKQPDLNAYALSAGFIAEKLSTHLAAQTLHPYQLGLASLYHEGIFKDEKGMRLFDIYIEPYYAIHETCVNKDHDLYKNKKAAGGFYQVQISIHTLIAETLADRPNLPPITTRNPRLTLVLGYPGQGKTSFIKRLLNDHIAQSPDRPAYLVRLRRIVNPRDLRNDPFAVLEKEIISQAESYLNQIALEVDLRNALLLLDGLDELYIKSDMSSQDVDEIVYEINRTAEQYPNLHIVLTSRYGYVNLEKILKNNILILQLAEFTPEQQSDWLKRYLIFYPESGFDLNKLKKYQTEEKFKSLRELITQPILLHLVASLTQDFSNAINRADIYARLFHQLILRTWVDEGNTEALKQNDEDLFKEALQEIAHAIFHAKNGYISKSDLNELDQVKELQKKLNNRLDTWRSLMIAFYLDETRKERSSENEADSEYGIEFLHPSLYEYLFAEKIWDTISKKFQTRPEKADDALNILYKVFGHKLMPVEIVGYLMETIGNDTKTDKNVLTQHLILFLEQFLECDFLPEEGKAKPLDTISAVFYGFWTILRHLQPNGNHFKDSNRQHLARFLKVLSLGQSHSLNLSGADLSGINLSGADLSGADLSGVNLSGAILFGISLSGANLSRAIFLGTHLYCANLYGVDLSGAMLSGATLSNAELSRADLNGANLFRTSLSGANLIHATLDRADLGDANLSGANMSGSNLSGAKMDGANMSDANLSCANLSGANLSGANLSGANLYEADLYETNLFGANLDGAILSAAKLDGAILSGANLYDVTWYGATLKGAILDYTILSSTTLSGIDLSGANSSNSKNITLDQLQSVNTLYDSIGLPPDIEAQLKQTHPDLFKDPKKEVSPVI